MVGQMRWLRTVQSPREARVIRPNFEAQVLAIKAAAEKTSDKPAYLVSQAVAGQEGTVYYITWLETLLGGLTVGLPSPKCLATTAFRPI